MAWLVSLGERSFVGTESRLMTLFDLLRQMNEGSELDPAARVRDLKRRRDEIDAEIERVEAGDMPLLNDTALKERFTQFSTLARELLADFREVEHNFRGLDRRVRERIALFAEEGRTMLVVTHEMGFARNVSNRVVFVHQGLIEAEGASAEMFEACTSERFRQFISSHQDRNTH